MIFKQILLVLLTPTKYCFQDQVTPPSDRLWVVNQTFTKLDMVYSDFMDSRKYGHHQFYLYTAPFSSNMRALVGGNYNWI